MLNSFHSYNLYKGYGYTPRGLDSSSVWVHCHIQAAAVSRVLQALIFTTYTLSHCIVRMYIMAENPLEFPQWTAVDVSICGLVTVANKSSKERTGSLSCHPLLLAVGDFVMMGLDRSEGPKGRRWTTQKAPTKPQRQ